MPDTPSPSSPAPADDPLTAALAEIRTDLNDRSVYPRRVMESHAPRLLAAIEAVLKRASELEKLRTVPPSADEDEAAARGIRWAAAQIREAITAALTGTQLGERARHDPECRDDSCELCKDVTGPLVDHEALGEDEDHG